MPQPLPPELVQRLRDRAADPDRRNDAPPTALGGTMQMGGVAVAGIDLAALLRGELPGFAVPAGTPAADPGPAAPASPEEVAAAEARLGFGLPPELRQLYLEVADGGFGPGEGLLPVGRLPAVYRERVDNPPSARRQPWPARLLPITRWELGHDCIDIASGEMVYWDEEELASGGSDKVWNRSFKKDAASLAAWLERWLDKPSPEEEAAAIVARARLADFRHLLKRLRANPDLRRDYRLPADDWEQALARIQGVDLSAV
jgi:hypothetical protein